MKSKRIICALTMCLVLSSSILVNADVNEEVKNAQAKYREYQEKIDEVNSKVYALNGSIEELVASIEDTNNRVKETENDIAYTEVLIEESKKDIEAREKIKDVRVREMYKSNVLFDYVDILLSSKNLSDLISAIDGISKIVDLDKEVIGELENDKKALHDKVLELEGKRKDLETYSKKLEEDRQAVEVKKAEQEEIIRSLESERSKFGSEVLEVAERELVKYQIDSVSSANDIGTLTSLVTQLRAVRDNQLTMPRVVEEVNTAIESAKSKIANIEAQLLAEEQARLAQQQQQAIVTNPSSDNGTSRPNRGSVAPTGSATSGQAIVDYAYQFLGRAYVWGAVGPDVFDCSGLTSYVYRHAAGIEITRTTYTQINVGTPVSYDQMQPGDLVFTYDNEHVGIYVGGGMYINATYPGSTVRVTPVTDFYAARRVL